ncbi:MAG: M20/M25/M40 family metallo-hydrolase [Bacteroidales bacterium]|nr:M20/M25/M40 family metallo-hydrolase [Bacteroidales bacterium]
MKLFEQILSIDSTSGKERELGLFLAHKLQAEKVELLEVGDGTVNLFLSWGEPKLVFCTHLDTVPPYIPPRIEQDKVWGRGACDAKGQIYSMYQACQRLAQAGKSNFGLLLLSGEETGSFGAKAFAKTSFRAPYLVVGEPTDNCLVSASKGTRSYSLCFKGKAFHSGYPEMGLSAVELFVDFVNRLRAADFPEDPVLGRTSYNIGALYSENPQNILSPELCCRVYFRTTFAAEAAVEEFMSAQASECLEVKAGGGDQARQYYVIDGIPSKVVSFGSDAPHLSNFEHKMICGPGSIMSAHRDEEHIEIKDIETAIENYIKIYESCN